MDESLSDLLFWSALAVGGAAMVWRLTNDDGDPKSRQRRELEKRLARYPASAGAVIIKAQPRRGWWRLALAALLAIALMFASTYMRSGLSLVCDRVGAAVTARWLMLAVFPGFPVVLTPVLAFEFAKAVRIWRGGYAPPLDTVVFQDTIAVTGWRARLQAVLGLVVMPMLFGLLFHTAYGFRQSFEDSRMQGAKCPAWPSNDKGGLRR
ncbi:hypothetical protein [Roseateles sp. P5_E7]